MSGETGDLPSLEKGGLSRTISRSEIVLAGKGGFGCTNHSARLEPSLSNEAGVFDAGFESPPFSREGKRPFIVAAARSWLGTPYVHQACAKGHGTDCLGLIRGLYAEVCGHEPEAPPPYTPDWNERRAEEEPLLTAARRHLVSAREWPKRGQILIFRIVTTGPAKHCGVVTGPDHFIHAYAGRAVIESWLSRWWAERVAGVFDFPGVEE